MEFHILSPRPPRRARRPAVHASCLHRIIESPVRRLVARDNGRPAKVNRCRGCQLLHFNCFTHDKILSLLHSSKLAGYSRDGTPLLAFKFLRASCPVNFLPGQAILSTAPEKTQPLGARSLSLALSHTRFAAAVAVITLLATQLNSQTPAATPTRAQHGLVLAVQHDAADAGL
jgi:hypothetical protein